MLALCEFLGKLREKNQFSERQNTKEQKNNVISLKNEDAGFTKVNRCPFFDLALWLISSGSTDHFKYFEHFKE